MKYFWVTLFAFGLLAAPMGAGAQAVTVIVNGQTMNFAQPPVERTGRVFVPLRGIFEQLGATVVYQSGRINATAHGRTVSLTIGSTEAVVAGQPQTLDVAPFIIGATTFVPLRFISQALGATVDWNDSTSTVTIRGGGGQPPYPPRQPRPVYFVSYWPSGTVYNATPTIRFQFNRPIVLDRLRIRVDGNRLTVGVRQTGPASYALDMPYALPRGSHHVQISGVTESGLPFDLAWDFIRG